ncbi:hypothetical protein LTR05_000959 [Lithohypha guttulata]|uniref:Arylsulfatase n=1 Tax=Lithohypha guttulata TaxID=1690604 RepID=A0AAN7YEH5_9EURO|nr:hypothetical protein LTR05_000959 [Lithohypha guttulata]
MIMTDDQDLKMNSIDYQPLVQKYFKEQGTTFTSHYCTIAQCCPSRVSLLTGKAAHNTNVTDVRAPFGGYSKFVEQGLNGQWLPSWFQQGGYNTYYVGKLMNNHSVQNYNKPFPQGFNATDFLIDPGTYIYYNSTMQSNTDPPRNLPNQYSTDVVASRAMDFMQAGIGADAPFFLTVAPIGPHGQTIFPRSPGNPSNFPIFDPPVAAQRHQDLYQGVKVPRTSSYNPEIPNSPSYLKNLPRWNQTVIDYYDEFYRIRLASLAAVDELVESIMTKAEQLGILDNTIFIYTSDNGFHIGQHRLPAGKSCAYEEDINIPFFIRGPGIAKNATINSPTSHTDIAPTLFELAGLSLREDFDGIPMPVTKNRRNSKPDGGPSYGPGREKQVIKQEHVNVEFWGSQSPEGKYGASLMPLSNNNTYKSVRLVSLDFNLVYVVWCTNERELYEMQNDPEQMQNLAITFGSPLPASTPSTKAPYNDPTYVAKLQNRLDTLLMVLKTCKGNTCVQPWKVMHPDGSVNSLSDAMNSQYDDFYAGQPKIAYVACAQGYLRGLEGPGADTGDVHVWSN